jgi:alkylated DNA repair dioxygenase AlkB
MAVAARNQASLFGRGVPAVQAGALARIRRRALDHESWIDHLPGWVTGHDELFEELVRTTAWRSERRRMYDRVVEVPRLIAGLPADGPGHPLLLQIRALLEARYQTAFVNLSLGYYRDGEDSVAWHGDTTARELPEAIVATVSLGEPRRFLLRPRAGGRSIALALGWGDLLVMGGACQRTWRHCVPKARQAGPRLAVMYRPLWQRPLSAHTPPAN